MPNSPVEIIILAAGKGTRMHSALPKVLHPIGGKPMLARVLETSQTLLPVKTQIIIGHGAQTIQEKIQGEITWVMQTEQLGTGHAVQQATLQKDTVVLILYGDVPLISQTTLASLLVQAQKTGFALLSALLDNPEGYGRIVRDHGTVQSIVEHKDANTKERAINEINTGIMAVSSHLLKRYLSQLNNNNTQGEYYLTDIVAMAVADGTTVEGVIARTPEETEGINNRIQQAQAERFYQQRCAESLMLAGATLLDPARIDIRGTLTVGQDVTIGTNTIFEGEVHLADKVSIGANSIIKNSHISAGSIILENCIIEDSKVGAHSTVGPFARLRPDTLLQGENKVGNFVEIKKSTIGKGSKINHLSYVGDTTMGEHCNVGAGTITCNYDGAFKHQTIIGDNVFVGSDTQLIAPITIDNNVTIGAGSTLSKDVSLAEQDELLILSRSKTKTIHGWKRPKK